MPNLNLDTVIDFTMMINPQLTLSENVLEFTKEQNSELIKAILFDKKIKAFEYPLSKEYSALRFRHFSTAELAFHWLSSQSSTWLNDNSSIIEKCWEYSCIDRDEDRKSICYGRIKALIDKSRAGISIGFIDRFLSVNSFRGDAQTEVDSYLLRIKLEEDFMSSELGMLKWEMIRDHIRSQIPDKPYLLVAIIYLHRRDRNVELFDYLWDLVYNWNDIYKRYFTDFKELRPYLVSYLKQWLFHSSYYEIEDSFYEKLDHLLDKSPDWIEEIFKEIFDASVFSGVKAKMEEALIRIKDTALKIGQK